MRKAILLLLTFSFFQVVNAQFAMNGTAKKLSDSTYQLTPKLQGQAGSIWDSVRLDVSQSFDISFNLRFGCSNSGEDGIAFVLQRDNAGLSAISKNANSMGYQNGILRSIAIEFDTDRNGTNDVANDHVAIHQNGAQNLLLAGPETMYLDARDVEDCGLHRVRVQYTASTNILVVYVGCQQRISEKIDLLNDIFNGAKNVYLGFTASNGSTPTTHLVQYLGNTPSLNFSPDLSAICPDTLVIQPDLNRNEFKDPKWELEYKGNVVHTINKYKDFYKAPQVGIYKVTLEVLRVCDSIKIKKTAQIEAINEVDIDLSYEIDTNCFDYEIVAKTRCATCEEIQWDFDRQKGAWGFPNQNINFTRTSDVKGYFWAQSRNASCTAEDSIYFDLKILGKSAPPIWFNTDTLCGGETLQVSDSSLLADSVVFTFTPGFGVQAQRSSDFTLSPTGFGKLGVFRTVYYSKYSCVFQDTHYIQIDTIPNAQFNLIDSSQNCNVVEYNFENTMQFAQSHKWLSTYDTTTAKNFSITVDFPRKLDVRLVTVNGACRDTAYWSTFPNLYYPPKASIVADTLEGCAAMDVRFNWTSEPLDSFYIKFNNGTDTMGYGRNASIKKTYPSGVYTITYITYSGDSNCIDTTILTDYITVRDSVVSKLGLAQLGGCPPFLLDASDSSFFGDSPIKERYLAVTKQNNTPRFKRVFFLNDEDTVLNDEGYYKVFLAVSNGFCTDTVGYEVLVKGLTKKDTADLFGVTINPDQQAEFSWKPHPVAANYDVRRLDDVGSQRIFTGLTDTLLLDKSINAAKSQYEYYLTAIDDCGGRSAETPVSTTILLKGDVNTNQEAELVWNNYEKFTSGVKNYIVEPINANLINTNGNLYFDDNFFDENRPDSGKCYRVHAVEKGGDRFTSTSNILCLDPIPQVFFPTAFSPDGNDENDIFMWKGVGIKSTEMRIFNRWGQKVFEGENNWDGTFETVSCQPGMYYYVATMVGANQETYFYSGQVYLLK